MPRTKLLSLVWAVLLGAFLLEGCLPEPSSQQNQNTASSSTSGSTAAADGKTVFKQHCITCHGANGQMGLNGAKNLKESILPMADRINLIKQGKGVMPAFAAQLSEKKIKAVAEYSMKFNPDL